MVRDKRIRDLKLRAKVGVAGRPLVEERYALSDQTERFAELLKGLVDRDVVDRAAQTGSAAGLTEKSTELASTRR
jgi:hypothetical protein